MSAIETFTAAEWASGLARAYRDGEWDYHRGNAYGESLTAGAPDRLALAYWQGYAAARSYWLTEFGHERPARRPETAQERYWRSVSERERNEDAAGAGLEGQEGASGAGGGKVCQRGAGREVKGL